MKIGTKTGEGPVHDGGDRDGGSPMSRLEFELALGMAEAGDGSLADTVRDAARAVGGDLILVLPAPRPDGSLAEQAVVRLPDEGGEQLIAVSEAEDGFALCREDEIAPPLAGLARASIAVLEQIGADARVVAPLGYAPVSAAA